MKRLFSFVAFFSVLFTANAQDKTTVEVNYRYALPMGAFKNNFIGQGSPRGISVDLLTAINPNWRIGGSISYQDFYEKFDRQLYPLEDGSTLSAVMTNSLQVTPIMAKALYLPLPENRLQPVISAGAGVNMVQVQQLFGQFDNVNNVNFGFAAQGGLGLKYALGEARRTNLTAGVQYNIMPFNRYGIGNLNHLSFGAGVRFTLRQGNNSGSRDDGGGWNDGRRQPRNYRW